MSNGINISVIGFDKLLAQIKQLADSDKRTETLILLRESAKPTVQAAKGLVPVSKKRHIARGSSIEPRSLQKSIGLITGRRAANPTIYAGPRAKGSFKGWYGHFVHDGVNIYRTGFKRKHVKGANASAAIARTKSNPFMTNAFRATEGVVTADAEKRMAALIQRRINKLS